MVTSHTAVALSCLRTTVYGEMFPSCGVPGQVENGKPAPDLFLAAAAALGLPPADCLAIEDAPAGVAVRPPDGELPRLNCGPAFYRVFAHLRASPDHHMLYKVCELASIPMRWLLYHRLDGFGASSS